MDGSKRKLAQLGGDALQCLWEHLQLLQPQNLAPPTLFSSSFKMTVIVPGDAFNSAPANASSNNVGPSASATAGAACDREFLRNWLVDLLNFARCSVFPVGSPVISMEACCPITVAPTDGASSAHTGPCLFLFHEHLVGGQQYQPKTSARAQ